MGREGYERPKINTSYKANLYCGSDTPIDHYNHALSKFGDALQALDEAFNVLSKVAGDNGQPMVEVRGVEPRLTHSWRDVLRHVDEEMVVWARTFGRAFGTKVGLPEEHHEDDDGGPDPYAQSGQQADDDWLVRENSGDPVA